MSTGGNVTKLPFYDAPDSDARADRIRRHLDGLLQSGHFSATSRSREFLAYVVDEVLSGRGAELSQASIAVAVFGRKADFDAILDPIVRVQAGRLRRSLERYYLLADDTDEVRIELPRGSYAPVFRKPTPGEGARDESALRIAPSPESAWPAVLVRPLASAAQQDSDLAAQLHDELTRELYRHGDVRVVLQDDTGAHHAHALSTRFELLGTLRQAADRRLVGARLVDWVDGQQIWSEEFDAGQSSEAWTTGPADIARIIAMRIGAEQGVIGRVLASEYAGGHRDGSEDCNPVAAYQHVLFSRDVAELGPTIEGLERLVRREPEVAAGWVYLARLYLMNNLFELSATHTPIGQGLKYAYHAALLDPGNARARCVLAATLILLGELEAARDELDQALRLSGHSLAHRETIGWLMALAGDWERGMQVTRDAMARNPYFLPHASHALWADNMRLRKIGAAHVAALGYRDSGFFWRDLMIASCLGHLGRSSEAQENVAEVLKAKPQFPERGRTLIGHLIKPVELRETVIEGLRKAGLTLTS